MGGTRTLPYTRGPFASGCGPWWPAQARAEPPGQGQHRRGFSSHADSMSAWCAESSESIMDFGQAHRHPKEPTAAPNSLGKVPQLPRTQDIDAGLASRWDTSRSTQIAHPDHLLKTHSCNNQHGPSVYIQSQCLRWVGTCILTCGLVRVACATPCAQPASEVIQLSGPRVHSCNDSTREHPLRAHQWVRNRQRWDRQGHVATVHPTNQKTMGVQTGTLPGGGSAARPCQR